MSIARHHAEWLSLLVISDPFLSMPGLMDAFPQGLDACNAGRAGEMWANHGSGMYRMTQVGVREGDAGV